MKEYTLVEKFALLILDGQDSRHYTEAKKAALMGIKMAQGLQEMLLDEKAENFAEFDSELERKIKQVKVMHRKQFYELEKEIVSALTEEGALTEVPNLLGCDMNYYTAGVTMKEYKCDEQLYQRIREGIRADILEPGETALETVCFLWLLRECGCMHDLFSQQEQRSAEQRLIEWKAREEVYRFLLEKEFHNKVRNSYLKFLKWKHNLFRNPYLQGVNLLFPFFDRRQAIFIDMVIIGTAVEDRRQAVINFLREHGHSCTELPNGEETLLKIDNFYYRIWPSSRSCRIPIQGVEIVPAYR